MALESDEEREASLTLTALHLFGGELDCALCGKARPGEHPGAALGVSGLDGRAFGYITCAACCARWPQPERRCEEVERRWAADPDPLRFLEGGDRGRRERAERMAPAYVDMHLAEIRALLAEHRDIVEPAVLVVAGEPPVVLPHREAADRLLSLRPHAVTVAARLRQKPPTGGVWIALDTPEDMTVSVLLPNVLTTGRRGEA